MQNTQNLKYYYGVYDTFDEFNKNNQLRNQTNSFFRPESYLIEPLSEFFTNKIAMPSLKVAYSTIRSLTVKTAGVLRPSLSNRIDCAWRDPISTKTLLKAGAWIEKYARKWAIRKPSELPMIHYIDAFLIASTRPLYIFSKDMNTLLSIPPEIAGLCGLEHKRES